MESSKLDGSFSENFGRKEKRQLKYFPFWFIVNIYITEQIRQITIFSFLWHGYFVCNMIQDILIFVMNLTGISLKDVKTYNRVVTCDFQECCILTSVDSDKPVQPPSRLRNLKGCSVSSLTLIGYSSDKQRLWSECAYAQDDLRLCWSHIPHRWKSWHWLIFQLWYALLKINIFFTLGDGVWNACLYKPMK